MQFALFNGHRCESRPGHAGKCPNCGSAMIAKCGDLRVWHWAHLGLRHCDQWWEPESPWHRDWKNKFPAAWQEVSDEAAGGERHIADVKTADGRVVEFQHSPLTADERRSREAFYKSMIWVVDGQRRKRDRVSFAKTLHKICRSPLVYSGHAIECALLRDCVGRPVDVFFDFGLIAEDIALFGVAVLWHLHPMGPERQVFLTPIPKESFITALNNAVPFPPIRIERVARPAALAAPPLGYRRLESFEQYLARRQRSRRRF